jgi:hypothetical protein
VNYPNEPSAAEKALLREAGINYARITGGGYSWATEQHRAHVNELEGQGVEAILQLGSHYPSADYFPLTQSYFVDHLGATGVVDRSAWAVGYSGHNWPQYSYFSPEFRAKLEADFAQYLEAFRDAKNARSVILHNEPGYFWMRERLFDYGAPAITAFRKWLAQRYGSVQALNAAWGTSFASFETLEPSREAPPVSLVPAYLEWRRFHTQGIAEFLAWEHALARKLAPELTTTTNLSGPLDWWHAYRVSDNEAFSRAVDRPGIDIYLDEYRAAYFTGYALDMTRGVANGRDFEVLECDVFDPEKFPKMSEEQAAQVLEGFLFTQAAHGARGILLWWGGGGAYNLIKQGAYNPRLRALREVTDLSELLGLGAFRVPPRRVALVVDPDAYFFYTAGSKEPPYWLDHSLLGLYAALIDTHHEVDVLFTEQVRRGEADRYPALVFGNQTLMDEKLAGRIKAFVAAGGLVIAGARFADTNGVGRPSASAPTEKLDAVFGAKLGPTVEESPELTVGEQLVVGRRWRTGVEPTTASVLGRFPDGRAAVTDNSFGRGRALFLATDVGQAYLEGRSALSALLGGWMKDSLGVPDGVRVTHGSRRLVDAVLLVDDAKNSLAIATLPPDRDEPTLPVDSVTLTVPRERLYGASRAYRYESLRVANGRSVSAFEELVLPPAGDVVIPIERLDAASLVLFARNAPPLVGLDAPATVRAAAAFTARATYSNPSPKKLSARALLGLAGEADAAATQSIELAPFGRTVVELTGKAPEKPGRYTVRAVLLDAQGAPIASGIAHDLFVP